MKDKEWWQNSEALVGYLDAYEQFQRPEQYLAAFQKTWDFANREHMINHRDWGMAATAQSGRARSGSEISAIPWKAFYHSPADRSWNAWSGSSSSPSNQNPD